MTEKQVRLGVSLPHDLAAKFTELCQAKPHWRKPTAMARDLIASWVQEELTRKENVETKSTTTDLA